MDSASNIWDFFSETSDFVSKIVDFVLQNSSAVEGKIRSIGVSNFSSPQVANIMRECRIPVAVNQVECSLYFQQKKLRDNLAKMGVKVMAYSSLGSSGRNLSKLHKRS